ncbi:diguanylate cyclase [Candidatus Pelagadaptatus aseana]|uniref:diguanylate cyclase n=1 Tax=Candidatus Pelagadaptatus aseana TaxID=3120508 RepID=UPI003C7015F3
MEKIKKILVVEDSPIVSKIVRHVLKGNKSVEAYYAADFAQSRKLYEEHKNELFAALVDLNLPDAPDGEVVDYMLEQKVPTIVLTGSYDDQRREKLLSKGIVDYVIKEGRYSYDYAVNLVGRLSKNQDVKVLVVDDSDTSRNHICELLKRHLYQVVSANNGIEAIKVLLENPDIKLLITDYNMPVMDGFEMVQNIRHKYEKSDLVIIGLSGEGQSNLSAKFIKNGANDFLQKPFCQEEFYCRVTSNVESLELIAQIRDAAHRDHLTGLFNRRYFFEQGEQIYSHAQSAATPLSAVVLDIDYFKSINDTHGHEAGDLVLKQFAEILDEALGRFLVARTGGEEFFALLPGLDCDKASAYIDKVRSIVASTPMDIGESEPVYVSFSAGVTAHLSTTLDDQLNIADEHLYRAKDAGRNLVIGDDAGA